MKGRHDSTATFFIVSVLGALFLLVEAGLQAFGRSICVSGGCGLVAQLARFGDLSMILVGLAALAFLALLSGLNRKRRSGLFDSAINLALIAALAAEGFVVGYQVFWLAGVCLLCVSVFAIFVFLGFLRLLAGWKEAAAGFTAFAVVFCLVGLVLPPPGTALPTDKKMVLFYSAECRHCAEIKEEIDRKKLDIAPMPVQDYAGSLKNLGVDQVPTLLVNGKYEKLLLTGKEAIRRYLVTCQTPGESISPAAEAATLKKGTRSPSVDTGSMIPLLSNPQSLFNPSPDEGVCKEEQKCD